MIYRILLLLIFSNNNDVTLPVIALIAVWWFLLLDRCQGASEDRARWCSICSAASGACDAVLRTQRPHNSGQGQLRHNWTLLYHSQKEPLLAALLYFRMHDLLWSYDGMELTIFLSIHSYRPHYGSCPSVHSSVHLFLYSLIT